ncbi:hypothetical protein [Maritalea sp.]|uniref:hypothetical protein n=1 Tax=Maritalea sp. TaxID=2003361 RepID=UPI003EF1DFA5
MSDLAKDCAFGWWYPYAINAADMVKRNKTMSHAPRLKTPPHAAIGGILPYIAFQSAKKQGKYLKKLKNRSKTIS